MKTQNLESKTHSQPVTLDLLLVIDLLKENS